MKRPQRYSGQWQGAEAGKIPVNIKWWGGRCVFVASRVGWTTIGRQGEQGDWWTVITWDSSWGGCSGCHLDGQSFSQQDDDSRLADRPTGRPDDHVTGEPGTGFTGLSRRVANEFIVTAPLFVRRRRNDIKNNKQLKRIIGEQWNASPTINSLTAKLENSRERLTTVTCIPGDRSRSGGLPATGRADTLSRSRFSRCHGQSVPRFSRSHDQSVVLQSVARSMNSMKRRAYWSGFTVEISAPAPCFTVFAADAVHFFMP